MDERSPEFVTALEAVKMASALCQRVGKDLARRGSILKSDRSPVTIADFGSQAVICKMIHEKFPNDIMMAEEDSKELKKLDRLKILEQVTHYVNDPFPHSSSEEICSWIDFSSHFVADRFWTLDPIDGTKGFLRGDQYAIALALIEKGVVQMGVLSCPNLPNDSDQPDGKKGCVFFALRGKGSVQTNINGGDRKNLSVSKTKDP